MNREKFNKIRKCLIFALPILVVSGYSKADSNVQMNRYAATLGASRIIFSPGSAGSALAVSNPQDFPVLIQSKFLNDKQEKDNSFVVTPPIFRLEANQTNRLTIIPTQNEFSHDRESLKWLCVAAIPPVKSDNDKSGGNKNTSVNVNISLNNCIKFIIRPNELNAPEERAIGALTWHVMGNGVQGKNDTPYYVNVSTINVAGKKVEKIDYIPPYSSREFTFNSAIARGETISWTAVGDFGETSKIFSTKIQ